MNTGTFFISASIMQRNNRMKWCFILVYGPADHGRSDEFLGELPREVDASPYPVVLARVSISSAARTIKTIPTSAGHGSGGLMMRSPLCPCGRLLGSGPGTPGPTNNLIRYAVSWIECLFHVPGRRCSRYVRLRPSPGLDRITTPCC
jgi:hypothetical protein